MSDVKTTADVKKIATDFYRWWHNQPGTNTDDGFDSWLALQNKPADWHDQIAEKQPWCKSKSGIVFQVSGHDPKSIYPYYNLTTAEWVKYATPLTRDEILEMLNHVPEGI